MYIKLITCAHVFIYVSHMYVYLHVILSTRIPTSTFQVCFVLDSFDRLLSVDSCVDHDRRLYAHYVYLLGGV